VDPKEVLWGHMPLKFLEFEGFWYGRDGSWPCAAEGMTSRQQSNRGISAWLQHTAEERDRQAAQAGLIDR
jgi:hypothetical protein